MDTTLLLCMCVVVCDAMLEGMELVGALDKGFDIKQILDSRYQALVKER